MIILQKKTALKLDEKNKVQIWGFDFCCPLSVVYFRNHKR